MFHICYIPVTGLNSRLSQKGIPVKVKVKNSCIYHYDLKDLQKRISNFAYSI